MAPSTPADGAAAEGRSGDRVTPLPVENRGPDEPQDPGTTARTTPSQAPARAEAEEKGAGGGGPGGRGRLLKRGVLLLVVLAVLGAAGWWGYAWFTEGRFIVSTNDAYIMADMTIAAPKTSGYVASIPVAENSRVAKGEALVRLQTTDLQLAVQAAEDKVAAASATVNRLDSQLSAARTSVEQAEAQRSAAKARARQARSEFARTKKLQARGVATDRQLDDARAARDSAVAELGSASAAVKSARSQVGVNDARKAEAQAGLKQARTALAQARQTREDAVVRAPFDGIVGNFDVEEGEFVQPGKRLMAVVPIARGYVDANFKETQIARLAVGQKVEIDVDAFPDTRFTGRIESFAPASGSQFSLLPPENATGNFTKVVQRVPVRIRLDTHRTDRGLLRPGLSVVARVDTRTGDGTGTAAR